VRERKLDTPVYVISIAAELIGCHPRTLRIYEERGLLSPVRRRRIRLYSERDIQRIRLIRYLTEERGLNLAGVQLLLEVQEHYHEELTWVFGADKNGRAAEHDRESKPDHRLSEKDIPERHKGGRGR